MSDQIESQVVSRRKALFVVGLAASLAVPAVITASDAEAQQGREEKKEKREEKKEKREEKKEKREERKEKDK
jgi:ribosomal protein L12E/L44/L45/RPP1/RPP2